MMKYRTKTQAFLLEKSIHLWGQIDKPDQIESFYRYTKETSGYKDGAESDDKTDLG